VSLTATLTSGAVPLGGREVALYEADAQIATAVTDAQGRAKFALKATRSGSHQARFAPQTPADVAAYQPASSQALALAVQPLVRVGIRSPLRARRTIMGIPGVGVRIRGNVTPYVAGANVVVRIGRRGREVRRRTVALVQQGTQGRFAFVFKPRRRGKFTVRAEQAASAELAGGKARPKRLLVVRPHAGPGSYGKAVRALEQRLHALGYLTGVGNRFGSGTGRAVLAFRKVTGMSRGSSATRAVFRKLAKGRGRFRLRFPRAGRHVEFDWSRQVLVLAQGSRPAKILHASSGKPSTPTVFGHFRFYSKTPGFNSHGMYFSNYFIGGYAIHGYAEVPPFAASHGCIRIPIPNAVSVYRWINLGDQIFVYR